MNNKQTKVKIYKGDVENWFDWLKLSEQGYTGVSGDFYCIFTVKTFHDDGYYFMDHRELESLQGGPDSVGGDFYCRGDMFSDFMEALLLRSK